MGNKIKRIGNAELFQYLYLENEADLQTLTICESPVSYKNLPDGEYIIRGSEKGHRKYYFKYNNIWYLSKVRTDGKYGGDDIECQLFPQIPAKDWAILSKHQYALSDQWKKYLLYYTHWKSRFDFKRKCKFDEYKFVKNFDESVF